MGRHGQRPGTTTGQTTARSSTGPRGAALRWLPWLSLVVYTTAYAFAWYFVWNVHRTDAGDGLEYMLVFGTTLPWSVALLPVAAVLPDVGDQALFHFGFVVNALLIYFIGRRIAQGFEKRT